MMIAKAAKDENARHHVMGHHLMEIFPPLLNVDYDDLLYPECELGKVIPFEEAGDVFVGPALPELLKIQPVAGIVI